VKKKQLKKEGDSDRKTVVRIERRTRGFYSCVSWNRKTNTQTPKEVCEGRSEDCSGAESAVGGAGGFIESFIGAVQLAAPGAVTPCPAGRSAISFRNLSRRRPETRN